MNGGDCFLEWVLGFSAYRENRNAIFGFDFLKMKNPEALQEKVKQKLRSGYPAGELTNDLLQAGYSKEEINEAMNANVKKEVYRYYSPFTYLLGIFKILWGSHMALGINQNGNYLILSGIIVIGVNIYFQLTKK